MSNRKLVGICGGISINGKQDNSVISAFAEKEYGFYKVSPLDATSRFAEVIGLFKDVPNSERNKITNRVCRSGRTIDELIWLNLALKNVPTEKELILIDDIHFESEANALHKMGCLIFGIELEGSLNIIPEFKPDICIKEKSIEDLIRSFDSSIKYFLNP